MNSRSAQSSSDIGAHDDDEFEEFNESSSTPSNFFNQNPSFPSLFPPHIQTQHLHRDLVWTQIPSTDPIIPMMGNSGSPAEAPAPKNPRKRTRASRRAPTTVLTTDATNFRKMVQEFTGIPGIPFSGGGYPYSRKLNLFSAAADNSHPFFSSPRPPIQNTTITNHDVGNIQFPAMNSGCEPPGPVYGNSEMMGRWGSQKIVDGKMKNWNGSSSDQTEDPSNVLHSWISPSDE